jgi:pyruvate dehydrogenase E1 component beta subunit
LVFGEDVAVDGGVFRVTDGLLDKYGEKRVLDTPLAESGIAGFAVGLAVAGLKPVCEIQFSGFSYMALHQLEQHASRMRGRSGGQLTVPLVMRMPYGGGVRALEHHSESKEAYYAHTPGLKMVIPSTPRNARALLIGAIRDPDPVVFFESKAVYRAWREEVPDDEETMPLGRSEMVREGGDLTFVTYGAMRHRTVKAADRLKEEDGVEAEVIDLLTVSPLDDEKFTESVRKTGRVVVVHEAHQSFGPGAEIVARLVEKSFLYLEAPVARVTGFDVPIPLYQKEGDYLPGPDRIAAAARRTLDF